MNPGPDAAVLYLAKIQRLTALTHPVPVLFADPRHGQSLRDKGTAVSRPRRRGSLRLLKPFN